MIKKNTNYRTYGQWQMIKIIKRSVNKWQVYKLSAEDKVSSMECQQLNGLFGARLASHPLPLIITFIIQYHSQQHSSSFSSYNFTLSNTYHHSSSFSTSLSSLSTTLEQIWSPSRINHLFTFFNMTVAYIYIGLFIFIV